MNTLQIGGLAIIMSGTLLMQSCENNHNSVFFLQYCGVSNGRYYVASDMAYRIMRDDGTSFFQIPLYTRQVYTPKPIGFERKEQLQQEGYENFEEYYAKYPEKFQEAEERVE